MKPSFYNIIIPIDGRNESFIYNSRRNSLMTVSNNIVELLNNDNAKQIIDKIDSEELKALFEYGILLPSEVDEKTEVMKKDQTFFEQVAQRMDYVRLTICPTYSCNLKCSYCYERVLGRDMYDQPMSRDIQDLIIKYYQKKCKELQEMPENSNLYDKITWYGGEPLLNIEVIDDLQSKLNVIADQYGRTLKGQIVSNGTLLDLERQHILKRNKIKTIQITLDGPPQIHNKRRFNPIHPDRSFDMILDNLKSIDDYFNVSIRVNLDNNNSEYLSELLSILVENQVWPKKNIYIHLKGIRYYTDNNVTMGLSHLKFENINRRFREQKLKIFNEANMGKTGRLERTYPTVNRKLCSSSLNNNDFIIGPNGELCSCWNNVGNDKYVYGNIRELIDGNKSDLLYKFDYKMFRNDMGCSECQYLPICSIDCPESYIRHKELDQNTICTKWKFILQDILKQEYK
jgi:uncharacterized protein